MIASLFIEQLGRDPVLFFSVVTTVVVSVTLHELGHVFAALRQGDDTPRIMGHVTLDPMVHMGPMSLMMLAMVGIAWGLTPVNPSRFRGRYGGVIVAAAGPLVNLLLALLSLTALGIWVKAAGILEPDLPARLVPGTVIGHDNFMLFLFVFGSTNIVLFLLNLIPVPPLDGATVLAGVSPEFARASNNPDLRPFFLGALVLVVVLVPLFEPARVAAGHWIRWIA